MMVSPCRFRPQPVQKVCHVGEALRTGLHTTHTLLWRRHTLARPLDQVELRRNPSFHCWALPPIASCTAVLKRSGWQVWAESETFQGACSQGWVLEKESVLFPLSPQVGGHPQRMFVCEGESSWIFACPSEWERKLCL